MSFASGAAVAVMDSVPPPVTFTPSSADAVTLDSTEASATETPKPAPDATATPRESAPVLGVSVAWTLTNPVSFGISVPAPSVALTVALSLEIAMAPVAAKPPPAAPSASVSSEPELAAETVTLLNFLSLVFGAVDAVTVLVLDALATLMPTATTPTATPTVCACEEDWSSAVIETSPEALPSIVPLTDAETLFDSPISATPAPRPTIPPPAATANASAAWPLGPSIILAETIRLPVVIAARSAAAMMVSFTRV